MPRGGTFQRPRGAPVTPRAHAAFLHACALDVAVRKPGNVSWDSPGHGMQAPMFLASAQAAAGPLFARGQPVGDRIEAAVEASWAAAGCNTNLGIVLLCAPIAAAAEKLGGVPAPAELRHGIEHVLAGLTVDDARAAYRAIALARPGGLGRAPREDVRQQPTIDLRAAMALAGDHDVIARQYRDGYRDLFDLGLAALPYGFSPSTGAGGGRPEAPVIHAVQRLYLAWLARLPDSHIVRKHGLAAAHSVMQTAQVWHRRSEAGAALDTDPDFIAWDLELKSGGLNPGTTADLTVATLVLAGLGAPAQPGGRP